METNELYGKSFYACFVNNGDMDECYPFNFRNEYEMIETGSVDAFLGKSNGFYSSGSTVGRHFVRKEIFDQIYTEYRKEGLQGKKFIHDKLKLTGNLQIYYVTVNISEMTTAAELGEYGKWYIMEFRQDGAYSCKVQNYSVPPEEMFLEDLYRCNIMAVPKKENDNLIELFKVYPDGTHILEGAVKTRKDEEQLETLHIGAPVNSIVVWHCLDKHYLCVEFYDASQLPIGLFDMAFNGFVFTNYSDNNVPPQGGWGNQVPITVILSHLHKDHIGGLIAMANTHNNIYHPGTYHYFFQNIDLHLPDTLSPPSFNLIIQTIQNEGGSVTVHNDEAPFQAINPAFSYGLASFNHPVTGEYYPHPHLHGMYVRCQTIGGRNVLIAGDTVYRGIQAVGGAQNQLPHQGDLAFPYDVLIACHHGGNYAVSIAGNNYLPDTKRSDYIPIPGNNPVVIYSANGNGTGTHPHRDVMTEHYNCGWTTYAITNTNGSTYGTLPPYIAPLQGEWNGWDIS